MTTKKANINSYTAKITAATTNTQIFVAPWRIRKRYVLKKLILANENAGAATVRFYDDDLNDATTPARGDNANAPLLEFILAAGTTMTLKNDDLPFTFFQGGCVGYSSVNNVVVMAEIEED